MRVAFNLKLELYILAFTPQYWARWRAERRETVDVEWSHIDNMALLCLRRGRIMDPPLVLLGLGCFLASQKWMELSFDCAQGSHIWLMVQHHLLRWLQMRPCSSEMQKKHRLAGNYENPFCSDTLSFTLYPRADWGKHLHTSCRTRRPAAL